MITAYRVTWSMGKGCHCYSVCIAIVKDLDGLLLANSNTPFLFSRPLLIVVYSMNSIASSYE